MPDVFLSYKREDLKSATRLVEGLRAAGLDVWWDRDIPAGAPWETTIERALASAKVVLVCWSPAAVDSENVRSEARWARERGRLVQVFVKPCDPPLFFGERQGVDLSTWDGKPSNPGFQHLVDAIRRVLDGAAASASAPSSTTAKRFGAAKRSIRRIGLVIAIAILALGAGFLLVRFTHHGWASPVGGAPKTLRVATAPFQVLDAGDSGLQKFAAGLQAEIAGQLTQSRIDVVLPDKNGSGAGGAAYAFGGTAERDGDDFVVRVQLTDAHQHVTVWSDVYRRTATGSTVLQDQIAATLAEVASAAVQSEPIAKGDPELTTLMVRRDLYTYVNRDEDREAEWENNKVLLEKLPGISFVHSNFAVVSAFLAAISTPDRAADLRKQADQEIQTALKMNPHDVLAYFARVLLLPQVGHWRERENILLAGLKIAPQDPLLTNHESNLSREVGRLNAAVTWGRQAAAPEPHSANRDATLLLALTEAGQDREASALADTDGKAWPAHPAVWSARLQALIHQRRWGDAQALFAPNAYRPLTVSDEDGRAWIAALRAMASGRPPDKHQAARLMAALPVEAASTSMLPHLVYTPGDRIGMIAILGDNDDAFTLAARYLKRDGLGDSSFLFWPGLDAFRRDKRFWPFVTSIGLVDYWRSTGNWPDFCSQPGSPYDCKAQAAKLAAGPPAKT